MNGDIDDNDKYDMLDNMCHHRCKKTKSNQEIKNRMDGLLSSYIPDASCDLMDVTSGDILLDVSGISSDQLFKLGSLLAEEMGITGCEIDEEHGLVGFPYKDYVVILKRR